MNVQVIMKDGEPEYAILPYAEYKELLDKARAADKQATTAPVNQTVKVDVSEKHAPAPQPVKAESEVQKAVKIEKPADENVSENMSKLVQALQQANQAEDQTAFSIEKVVLLRNQKHIEQAQLARSAGISPVYLAQIEAGEREPGYAIWRGLANGLGVTLDDLKA